MVSLSTIKIGGMCIIDQALLTTGDQDLSMSILGTRVLEIESAGPDGHKGAVRRAVLWSSTLKSSGSQTCGLRPPGARRAFHRDCLSALLPITCLHYDLSQ